MRHPRALSVLKQLVLAAMLALAAASAPVLAVPPPPMTLFAQAGDPLLVRLDESSHLLVLQVESPSGLPWLSGAVPGPDGLELRLTETGVPRLLVLVSADAARAGRAASFQLGLRLRR